MCHFISGGRKSAGDFKFHAQPYGKMEGQQAQDMVGKNGTVRIYIPGFDSVSYSGAYVVFHKRHGMGI